MTAIASSLPAPAVPAAPPTRLRALGVIGLLASPMMLIEGKLLPLAQGDAERNLLIGVASLIYIAGFAASAVGLRSLRATGDGTGARLVFGVQMVGLALAAVWALSYVVTRGPIDTTQLFLRITDITWPLSHVFMLVVGTMVLRARRLAGWRRYPALLCGLALPLGLGMRAAAGTIPQPVIDASFPLLTTLGFGLLALALLTTPAAGDPAR
jgi:hypothetical protein